MERDTAKQTLCIRVPAALRRRLARIGKQKFKSTSELTREALLAHVERCEQELKPA